MVASSFPGSATVATGILAAMVLLMSHTVSAAPQNPGEIREKFVHLSVNGNSNCSRQCEWSEAPRMRRSSPAFRVRHERTDTE
jgi:phosphatidylethanolamine-binding protein (PEBP) family uncharacterized protein